jgi:hypothetical protein
VSNTNVGARELFDPLASAAPALIAVCIRAGGTSPGIHL